MTRDTAQMAAAEKEYGSGAFPAAGNRAGWHFLTGTKEIIDAVTKAANFRYNFDAKNNLFAHASGIMLLTPDGRISRYFYGVEFPGRDLRLGLVDASREKSARPSIKLLLFCYRVRPVGTAATAPDSEHHSPGRSIDDCSRGCCL